MAGCGGNGGCGERCPGTEQNREIVTGIIRAALFGIDIFNQQAVGRARVEVMERLRQQDILPCLACAQFDLEVESRRSVLRKQVSTAGVVGK